MAQSAAKVVSMAGFVTLITSATQITTVSDLKNRVMYFHTMDNREVRKIDPRKIDFSKVRQQMLEDGAGRQQVVKELSVQ